MFNNNQLSKAKQLLVLYCVFNCTTIEAAVQCTGFLRNFGVVVDKNDWCNLGCYGRVFTNHNLDDINGIFSFNAGKLCETQFVCSSQDLDSTSFEMTTTYDDNDNIAAITTCYKDSYGCNMSEVKQAYYDEANDLMFWECTVTDNSTGNVISVEQYDHVSILSGKYFDFKKNPIATIANGEGVKIRVDRYGNTIYKADIHEGLVIREYLFHRNTNVIKMELPYHNMLKHGTAKFYDLNGDIIKTEEWLNNELNGYVKIFENGMLKLETPYASNKKHGIEKAFDTTHTTDKQPKPVALIKWCKGLKHGNSEHYQEDGSTEVLSYNFGRCVSKKTISVSEDHILDQV